MCLIDIPIPSSKECLKRHNSRAHTQTHTPHKARKSIMLKTGKMPQKSSRNLIRTAGWGRRMNNSVSLIHLTKCCQAEAEAHSSGAGLPHLQATRAPVWTESQPCRLRGGRGKTRLTGTQNESRPLSLPNSSQKTTLESKQGFHTASSKGKRTCIFYSCPPSSRRPPLDKKAKANKIMGKAKKKNGQYIQYGWMADSIYRYLPCGSDIKESACNMRDLGSWSLGWEDALEKGKATHSSILAGEFHELYSPWGGKESDTTEQLSLFLTPPTSPLPRMKKISNVNYL